MVKWDGRDWSPNNNAIVKRKGVKEKAVPE
jgi:hypothetical protein